MLVITACLVYNILIITMKLRLLIYNSRYLFTFLHVSVNYVISVSLITTNKEACLMAIIVMLLYCVLLKWK